VSEVVGFDRLDRNIGLKTAGEVTPPHYGRERMSEFLKVMLERMETQIGSPASKIDANREAVPEKMMKANPGKADADREHMQQMMANIESDQEEVMARTHGNQAKSDANLKELGRHKTNRRRRTTISGK
jgi:hypothetical protein